MLRHKDEKKNALSEIFALIYLKHRICLLKLRTFSVQLIKEDKLIQERLRAALMCLCHGGGLATSPELTQHVP